VGERIPDLVAAGNHAQAARVAAHRIEIEGQLDVDEVAMPAVGVPARVARVEIAVRAHVIEVVAENAGGDALEARVVEHRAEVNAAVDARRDAGTALAVVRLAVV